MGEVRIFRLLKPDDTFVSIYHYQSIELEQILARRECEFFVKEGVTYKQTSSAVEDDIHIIYVKEHEHGPKEQAEDDNREITLESTRTEFSSRTSDFIRLFISYAFGRIKLYRNSLYILQWMGMGKRLCGN